MQHLEEAGVLLPEAVECSELICKQGSGLAGIGHRVIYALPNQLIVLHQAVVRVFRETDRRQYKRVNYGQLEQRVAGGLLTEDRHIEPHEIVAEHKRGVRTKLR